MQGENLESCRIRKSLWDGPFAMGSQYSSIGATYTIPGGAGQSPPYCLVINPGANASAFNVTMYMPVPSTVMWCHEIINVSANAITLKGANTGNPTIGTIAAGKRGEVLWNLYAAPPEWVCLLSA